MELWVGWEVGCGEVSLAHLRAMGTEEDSGTMSDISRVSGKASVPPELWEKPWPAGFLTATSQPLVPPV